MSRVTKREYPRAAPIAAAATTPPAGPDSRRAAASPAASPTSIRPPDERITCTRAARSDAEAARRDR